MERKVTHNPTAQRRLSWSAVHWGRGMHLSTNQRVWTLIINQATSTYWKSGWSQKCASALCQFAFMYLIKCIKYKKYKKVTYLIKSKWLDVKTWHARAKTPWLDESQHTWSSTTSDVSSLTIRQAPRHTRQYNPVLESWLDSRLEVYYTLYGSGSNT